MKFQVFIKAPDCFSEAVNEEAMASVNAIAGLSQAERESLVEGREGRIRDAISAWVEYGECVTLEFDTEAQTAVVVKR